MSTLVYTEKLVKEWLAAAKATERAQSSVKAARSEQQSAAQLLGRRMCPEDAKPGETFCFWVKKEPGFEQMIAITVEGNDAGDKYFHVKFRGKPVRVHS